MDEDSFYDFDSTVRQNTALVLTFGGVASGAVIYFAGIVLLKVPEVKVSRMQSFED